MRAIQLQQGEVEGILAGRKRQHALPVEMGQSETCQPLDEGGWGFFRLGDGLPPRPLHCPWDGTLWVKEDFFQFSPSTQTPANCRRPSGDLQYIGYAASMTAEQHRVRAELDLPLHHRAMMPQWASRLLLVVEKVALVRVSDLTNEQALLQGYRGMQIGTSFDAHTALTGLRNAWDEAYWRGYPWESNPFVWVLDFRWSLPVKSLDTGSPFLHHGRSKEKTHGRRVRR